MGTVAKYKCRSYFRYDRREATKGGVGFNSDVRRYARLLNPHKKYGVDVRKSSTLLEDRARTPLASAPKMYSFLRICKLRLVSDS